MAKAAAVSARATNGNTRSRRALSGGDPDGELEQLYRHAPVGLGVIDASLRFVRVNEQLAAFNERPASEHVGRTVREIIPRFADLLEPLLQKVLVTGMPLVDVEVLETLPPPACDPRAWLVSYAPIVERDGRARAVSVVVQDMSDRARGVRAERELRDRENRLRTIVETEPECVKVVSCTGALLEMNPAGLALLECSDIGQVRERGLLGFIAPEFRDAFAELHQRVIGGASGTLKFEVIGLKGGRRWLNTHAVPLRDVEGNVIALLGITRDVTEHHRSEESLKHSEQQLRALSARLQALREEERTRISREIHDQLGQLLTALRMDLELLNRDLRAVTDPCVRETLERRVAAAGSLIGDASTIVRRVASELRPGILDDLGLAAAVDYEARRYQQRLGLTVTVDAPAEVDVGDVVATACYRILQEALTNVARHADAASVRVQLASLGDDIQLVVEDDGCGLPDELRHDRRSLGLLGMRERAAALGGEVAFGAGTRGGTRVIVRLPRHPLAVGAEARA